MILKSFLVWCLIASVEVLHGISRAKLLAPRVGDFKSRQIGVLTGSFLILLITYFSFSWMQIETQIEAFQIGLMWFVCMFVFEMTLGHYFFRFSWKWLLADFNIFKGRLLALGMILLALAPWLMGKCLGSW